MKQLDPKAVWLFYYPYFANGLIIGILIFLIGLLKGNLLFSPTISLIITLGYLMLGFVYAKLAYKFYKYELTKQGFCIERGVIWKKYVTIPYERIQNVDIYRGLLARILGLSDLNIQTAGMSTTVGSYGGGSEGRLLGLSREEAERVRDELIKRAKSTESQGL